MTNPLRLLSELMAPEPGAEYGDVLPLKRTEEGLALGWPNMLRQYVGDMADLLDGTRTGEVPPNALMALSGTALGVGSRAMPKGALGMFAGERAAHADDVLLREAKTRAYLGDDLNDVWRETGWYIGNDGKWRFEVDDSAAKLRGMLPQGTKEQPVVGLTEPNVPLKSILEHDELYRQYPELAELKVNPVPKQFAKNIQGMATPEDNKIYIAEMPADNFLSTMLHELQHIIQHKEGFAEGGNTTALRPKDLPAESNKQWVQAGNLGVKSPYGAMEAYFAEGTPRWKYISDRNKEDLQKLKDNNLLLPLVTEWTQNKFVEKQNADAHQLYRRLFGEAEARNVQGRRPFTAEERAMSYPLDTLDIPENSLFLRRSDIKP